MIITKLNGGLGNQLFQYALGRHLSIKNHTALKFDLSTYTNNQERSYALSNYKITAEIASAEEISRFKPEGIKKIINKINPFGQKIIITDKLFTFNNSVLGLRGDKYLDGYWQSEKYFKDIENVIRSEITLKKELSDKAKQIEKNILLENSVSLHIRHGDYLNEKMSKIFEICGLDYYSKAIEKITETQTSPTFFIFSDNIEWAKNKLKINFPIFFISDKNLKNHEELFLMSKCKHNIIANSSFSWWGAWLNNNPNKIIIAPKKWIRDARNIEYLIPSSWIKI